MKAILIFNILRAWSQVLKHPAERFFSEPFFHVNEGRNPREAKGHLFALHAIHPSIRGLLLLDGDNRGLPDHELIADGLSRRPLAIATRLRTTLWCRRQSSEPFRPIHLTFLRRPKHRGLSTT